MKNIKRTFLVAIVAIGMAVTMPLRVLAAGKILIEWSPAGKHPGMQYTDDGRPKFAVETIDFVNNEIVFAYVRDGVMEAIPKAVGVAWFNMPRHVQDTNLMENTDEVSQVGTELVVADFDKWKEEGRDGDTIYYRVGGLEQNIGERDPVAVWMYYIRFDDGITWTEGNTYWNGQIEYTQCIIQYRDMPKEKDGLVLTKANCRAEYHENRTVGYRLEVEYGVAPEKPEETDDGGSGVGEIGSGNDGSSDEEGGEDDGRSGEDEVANKDGGRAENENAAVLSNASNGDMGSSVSMDWLQSGREYSMTVTRNGENEVTVFWPTGDADVVNNMEGADTQNGQGELAENKNALSSGFEDDSIEVPELGGEEEGSSWDKVKWWLIIGMVGLGVGICGWWLIPIIRRKKKEEKR